MPRWRFPPCAPLVLACTLAVAAVESQVQPPVTAPQAASPWAVTFSDIAERAGLREPTVYGGLDRKRFIIETNGAGVALLDYDNDGWLDALILSGTRLKDGTRDAVDYPPGSAPTNRLYRNRRNGTLKT